MKNLKKVILVAAAALALILLAGSFYIVQENEYACVVRFSKIIETRGEAGLYLKIPFVDSTKTFPKAIQFYNINPSEVLTSDKQNMTVDSYVLWRIADPLLFYQALGTTAVAEQRLDALTYNALKNVMGTLSQSDIISEDAASARNDIFAGIAGGVAGIAKSYGIDVVDVKIKRFDLPEANQQAVYARMISERNQMAEKYAADGEYEASLIRNGVDRQVNILVSDATAEAAKLKAEGEAEYMRILAEAYGTDDKRDFYTFTLELDALKASLTGGQTTLILGRDSTLTQLLIGK